MNVPANEAPRRGPEPRSAYAAFRPITTRWMDNDVYGHVNNVVYYSFFDTTVAVHLQTLRCAERAQAAWAHAGAAHAASLTMGR